MWAGITISTLHKQQGLGLLTWLHTDTTLQCCAMGGLGNRVCPSIAPVIWTPQQANPRSLSVPRPSLSTLLFMKPWSRWGEGAQPKLHTEDSFLCWQERRAPAHSSCNHVQKRLPSPTAEYLTGLGAIHANGAKGGKVIAIPCIFSGTFYKGHLLDYFVSGQEDFYYMQLSS